jgi:hypothetical protein
VKRPFVATGNVGRLLPETVLGRASVAAGEVAAPAWVSPEAAAIGAQTEV